MNTHAFSWLRGRAARYAVAALAAVAVLAFGAFAPAAAQAAAPATLYVSQGGLDSGICPLANPCATVSYALTQAASGATIKVSGTIHDHLTIASPVTITTWPNGPAVSPGVLDGAASGTVVTVNGGVTGVTLHDLTIENGSVGIFSNGTLTLTDSTVSGNAGAFAWAGIRNYDSGTMTIIDSTVTKNSNATVGSTGSGVYSTGAMTVIASTISGNTLLGSLASNGGPTQTMLPGTKSAAANVIPKTTTLRGVTVCPGTDQRGVARPGHGETRCTIGAAEAAFNIATTTAVTVSPATVTSGTRVVYLAVVAPKSGTGTPAGTITFTTGSTTLCTAVLSGGVAACGAANAPAGTDTVTGTYSGGSGFASSSGTATLTVT